MEVPKERAIMNALFCHECATLHKEYAKTHKRVVGPIDTFKSEIFTLEDADRGSVTYTAAMANYARQEEKARQARGEIPALHSRNTNCGRDNRRGNNHKPYNIGQGRGRDRPRDDRDHRSRGDPRSQSRRPARDDDRDHRRGGRDQSRGHNQDRGRDHNRGCDQSRGRDRGRDRGRHHDAHAMDEDRSRSRSRDRDDRSSRRSDSRSHQSIISGGSGDANTPDFSLDGSHDASYARDVYCVEETHAETALKSEQLNLKPGEARLSSRLILRT